MRVGYKTTYESSGYHHFYYIMSSSNPPKLLKGPAQRSQNSDFQSVCFCPRSGYKNCPRRGTVCSNGFYVDISNQHLKYGSEEKGCSLCKCSILLGFLTALCKQKVLEITLWEWYHFPKKSHFC